MVREVLELREVEIRQPFQGTRRRTEKMFEVVSMEGGVTYRANILATDELNAYKKLMDNLKYYEEVVRNRPTNKEQEDD